MISTAVLCALLSLPLPLAQSQPAIDAEDLGRGFGATAPQLVNAVAELEQLGLPVRIELTLERADGVAAAEAHVLATWRGGRSLLRADEDGHVQLSLDEERLDTLELMLPEGLRAEIAIPFLDELGFAADCPNSDELLRAAGC